MKAINEAYKEIGPRLRGLREALDMSVDDLAERLEVTPEEVARYESGTEEIPVSFLANAAHACGVGLTVLVSGAEAHLNNYSVVKNGRGLSVERRKDYDYKNLAYRFIGRRIEPFLITVPPKEKSELCFNRHPGQEFIHVLSGRLEITLGDNAVELEPGDSLYFNSHTPHALRGLDGEPARFIDVIS